MKKVNGKHIMVFAALFLIFSYLMIYLIDLHNVIGARNYFLDNFESYPFFWYQWFENGGPVEIFQYFFLGIAALISIINAGKTENKSSKFWYIMGFSFLLMLIEDAGDIRHTLRIYVQMLSGESEQGFFGTLTELAYFIVLGSIPLYGLLRYGRAALKEKEHRSVAIYFIFGFILYSVAVIASFAGSAFHGLLEENVYMLAGNHILDLLIILGDEKTVELYSENKEWISFFLMDSVVEETLELIASGLLLSAVVSFHKYHNY